MSTICTHAADPTSVCLFFGKFPSPFDKIVSSGRTQQNYCARDIIPCCSFSAGRRHGNRSINNFVSDCCSWIISRIYCVDAEICIIIAVIIFIGDFKASRTLFIFLYPIVVRISIFIIGREVCNKFFPIISEFQRN